MNDIDNKTALYAFRKFGDTVLRTAYACSGSMSEAEDITQEVFLTLHAKPQTFTNDEHLKAWLLRAAINRCKNYHKSYSKSKRSSIDEVSETELSYNFTPKDTTVRDAVSRLSEKYSTIIHLYYYEEYSIKEIAEMLEKSENTISSLLRRGRQKLKIELEEEQNYEKE